MQGKLNLLTRARRERQKRLHAYHSVRVKNGLALGALGVRHGTAEARRVWMEDVSVDKVRYWKRKVLEEAFHPGPWGGVRWVHFF